MHCENMKLIYRIFDREGHKLF